VGGGKEGVPASMTRRARENEAEDEAEADRDARQPAAGLQGHGKHSQALANPYQNLLGSLSARDQRLLDRLPLIPPASFHGPSGCGLWHASTVIGSACSRSTPRKGCDTRR
jgi:hypothetical protein